MLTLGGAPIPVASLAETLGLRGREPLRTGQKVPGVIVAAGDKRMAFLVDEFLTEQEVVIKSLGARIRRLRHVSAVTILPSGRIAPVLNSANLVRTALTAAPSAPLAATSTRTDAKAKKRILVVDDSVTTRTLEKSILEAAGYEVTVAADGVLAWQMLQERGVDLIVSDVEMPRMDGFQLTETVRASKRFHELPVVLVTARESEADKAHGIEVQADAYLGKSRVRSEEFAGDDCAAAVRTSPEPRATGRLGRRKRVSPTRCKRGLSLSTRLPRRANTLAPSCRFRYLGDHHDPRPRR